MTALSLHDTPLGFEVHDGEQLIAQYRATEELPRTDAPKPCFHPLHTPSGIQITEYRPADHTWHTGLYFGWVHANQANLWGGGWYIPERDRYEDVEHTHGVQRHDEFTRLETAGNGIAVEEQLTWLDQDDDSLATETRTCNIQPLTDRAGYRWVISTRIEPTINKLTLGASRAARYSGLELRMGPPFAEAFHRCSEGREGHEAIMGQHARWVSAEGATGGQVVMMDHPSNPRHPVTWFTRANLLGAGLLMEGDLEIQRGESLDLRYAFLVLDAPLTPEETESCYADFAE
jgi:hypothetical protein